MNGKNIDAEVERLGQILARAIVNSRTGECLTCEKRNHNPTCEKFELAQESRRRAVGRARLHLETAAENIDRAFEHIEWLGEELGG